MPIVLCVRRVVTFAVLVLVMGAAAAEAQQMYDPAQEGGSLPRHGALHLLPWETIDTYSGAVTLSQVDLALPANAGFGLAIRRVYNSKDGGWVIDAGAPWVYFSQGYPVVFNPDRSTTRFVKSFVYPYNIFYSPTTFARFDPAARIMVTAGGVTYHFRADGRCDYRRDPFNNTISYAYEQPPTGPARLWQVTQSLGSNPSRVVTFGYDAAGHISTMTYGTRVWHYTWGNRGLTHAQLPTGETWYFEYTDMQYGEPDYASEVTMRVTTPAGGWVWYTCLANASEPPDEWDTRWNTFTIRERRTGGADIPSGRWLFSYSNQTVHQDTVVDGVDGTDFHAAYRHWASYWEAPLEYVIEGTGAATVETDYTWQPGVQMGWPEVANEMALSMWGATLPDTQTIRVNGKSYTKTYIFDPDNFNHFGQPTSVEETGDFTRTTTTNSFQAFASGLYRADAPTSVTVSSAGDSQTLSATYESTTGSVLTQTAAGVTTTFTRGDFGNVSMQSVGAAPNTQDTSFEYDKGVVRSIHGPISTVTMEINDDGTVHTRSQAGRTTTFDYYPDGRQQSVAPPLGNAMTTEYATDGSWAKVSRDNAWTKTCFDGFGRTKSTITSAMVRADVAYDAMGRVRRTTLPFGTSSELCPTGQADTEGAATTFVYDILGRVTSQTSPDETFPDGTFVAFDYTTESGQSPHILTTRGHWDGTTPVVSRSSTQMFEATGSPANARLKELIDAAGTTTYDYNGLSSLRGITSPAQATAPTSVTRTWTYNADNRLASAVLPESGETLFTYDAFGRLSTWRSVPLDQTTTYHYDAENRIIAVDSPEQGHSITNVEYDAWGNRIAVSNGFASSTFEYDGANRMRKRTDVINGHRFETGFDFDLNDNLTDLWYASGNHVQYSYDPNNRLTAVSDAIRDLTFAHDFHYYDWGGLEDYTTGNGVVHSIDYDGRQRTHHIGSTKTTTDDVLGLTYGYDDVGNVETIQDHDSAKSSSFGYDALNRLQTALGPWGSLTWGYDAIGNRLSQTKVDPNNNTITTSYGYTSTNRLDHQTTGGDTETFHYDDAGRLRTNAQGTYTYDYTPNNLQKTALVNGGLWTYWYDADDQRVRKVFGSEENSTYYVRGPMGVLSEFTGSVSLIGWSVDYIYAAGRLIATTKPPAGAWHDLAVIRAGVGTVTSSPTGLDCGSVCEGQFTEGSQVTLTAMPNEGQTFLGWGGACGTGTSSTATVTIGTSSLDCTATFSGGDPEQLTVSKTGSGAVSSSPGGISCGSTCSAEFAHGTSVTLTATPADGSRIASWGGGCVVNPSSPSTATVTMLAASSCTATFTRIYPLTVTKTGDGWAESSVTSSPGGISCGSTCTASYDSETSVTLTADPAEGYEFESWSGLGCTSTGGTTASVVVDQARSCTAHFGSVPQSGCDPAAESDCLNNGGSWDSDFCECHYWWQDPLLIALDGHHIRLTGVAGGVPSDVDGDGVLDRVAWTVSGAQVGFLVLDRNGNGVIDSLGELFGRAVSGRRQPEGLANSFADLAAFDRAENGGNGDRAISAADAVFTQLRLWVDADHDGVSQPAELVTLPQAGIASIDLTAQPVGRRDRFGNYFRARAVVHFTDGLQTTVWDVFLAARLNGAAAATAAGWTWGSRAGSSRFSAGVAGVGAGLIALGLAALLWRRRRSGRRAWRPLSSAVSRIGMTGATTVVVVLLWPASSFGQTWQVVEYYDSDALGSVRAVTNNQGQVIARHDFLPFGEEQSPQTPPHDKRLFTGQERDFETGQDYFNARQLRTDLGRFLTPDPIALAPQIVGSQGINSYAYVLNNPLSLVDPSGLDPTVFDVPRLDSDWSPTSLPDGSIVDPLGYNPLQNPTINGTVTVLGQSVSYTIAPMDPSQASAVLTTLNGIVAAINAAGASLTQGQISDIKAVTAIYFVPKISYAGGNAVGVSVTSKDTQFSVANDLSIVAPIGTFVMGASNLSGQSYGYLGSAFVHEGVHIINHDSSTVPAEQDAYERRAYAAQYSVAKAFHLTLGEITFLQQQCGPSCR